MKLTIFNSDTGTSVGLELHNETLLETLRHIIEAEFQIPLKDQILTLELKTLLQSSDGKTLNELGLKDNACVVVNYKQDLSNNNNFNASQRNTNNILDIWKNLNFQGLLSSSHNAPPPQEDYSHTAENLLARSEKEPQLISILTERDPAVAEALYHKDKAALIIAIKNNRETQLQKAREQREKWERVMKDPMSFEAQELLLEKIKRQQIEESYLHAQEYLPESFGNIVMIYVPIEVNKVALTAFVDSGAQSTIMSQRCAEKCGLMRLVDTRFHGIAQGVGTSKIVGRIHVTQIKLGGTFFAASIIVIEDAKLDFLFGLDLLRRHQCILDFKQNVLRVGDEELPFLSEHEINEKCSDHFAQKTHLDISMSHGSGDSINATKLVTSSQSSKADAGVLSSLPHQLKSVEQGQAKKEIEEECIRRLMSVGATKEEAVTLLQQTGWNPDIAASLLFQQNEFR